MNNSRVTQNVDNFLPTMTEKKSSLDLYILELLNFELAILETKMWKRSSRPKLGEKLSIYPY